MSRTRATSSARWVVTSLCRCRNAVRRFQVGVDPPKARIGRAHRPLQDGPSDRARHSGSVPDRPPRGGRRRSAHRSARSRTSCARIWLCRARMRIASVSLSSGAATGSEWTTISASSLPKASSDRPLHRLGDRAFFGKGCRARHTRSPHRRTQGALRAAGAPGVQSTTPGTRSTASTTRLAVLPRRAVEQVVHRLAQQPRGDEDDGPGDAERGDGVSLRQPAAQVVVEQTAERDRRQPDEDDRRTPDVGTEVQRVGGVAPGCCASSPSALGCASARCRPRSRTPSPGTPRCSPRRGPR